MATAGCWVTIYRDTDYKGTSLRLEGPNEYSNMEGLPGANEDWGDQIGSVKTGPTCWVVGYADVEFEDTKIIIGPDSQIPDLGPMEDEIDSIKIMDHKP